MRILYLVYAPHNSFEEFCNNPKTGFSWVDSLLEKIAVNDELNIGLAIPINSKDFKKASKDNVMLYGLPNPYPKSNFRKIYDRVSGKIENEQINSYVDQAISDFNPDIIQIFGSESPFGLICKHQSIPVIIYIQGYLISCIKKWFAGLSRWHQFRHTSFKDLLRWRGFYHDHFFLQKRADREKIILENCKYYIGRTGFDKRIANLFAPRSQYYHCEEMLRVEFFQKEWNPSTDDKLILISTINGMPYKGMDLLFETSMVLSHHISIPFEFRLCGVSDSDPYVKVLKKVYAGKCDFSKIKFLGKLTAKELADQLCLSDLYIHPSYIENSPNSVCEAMALGMPIISTNVGGVSSILNDKIEGLLVQEGEPYSLAAAIVKLTKEKEYAETLRKNARARAIARHNPDKITNDILSIYRDVIMNAKRHNESVISG